MQPERRLIDFHSHFYNAAWYPTEARQGPSGITHAWPLLTNIEAQLAAMDDAGIDAKVLSAPASVLLAPGDALPVDLMKRINDHFAKLVAVYPQRLFGLATIDPFQGDVAAREVERAVKTLGLGGICIDCSQGDRYLDDPAARPTLEQAAALGVPVFAHPVSPAGLSRRLSRLGHIGTLIARGTEDAASVIAMLRSGILDELPDLNVVIPMLGAGAFLFSGIVDKKRAFEDGWQGVSPSVARKRLYVDTMGFDSLVVRFVVELLGHEHVLIGSDWPIFPIASRHRVEEMLALLNLSEEQQAAIMGGNTARLLARRAER